MLIPIRPDYRDEWDQYTVDEVRSPYPPVSASLIRIRRLAQERMQRELRAQRRAERKATLLVGAFIAPMTPRQWRLHHAVTHIMILALLSVWGLLGVGIYRWVRS